MGASQGTRFRLSANSGGLEVRDAYFCEMVSGSRRGALAVEHGTGASCARVLSEAVRRANAAVTIVGRPRLRLALGHQQSFRSALVLKPQARARPVEFRGQTLLAGSEKPDRAANVSQGGICLLATEPLTGKTLVSMAFTIPNEPRVLKMLGRVMWVSGAAMGIRLDVFDLRLREAVQRCRHNLGLM